jgi:hypothetical protein
VPLSEHEQRQLEQIEQALYREDPKFGRLTSERRWPPGWWGNRSLTFKLKVCIAFIILVLAGALGSRLFAGVVYTAHSGTEPRPNAGHGNLSGAEFGLLVWVACMVRPVIIRLAKRFAERDLSVGWPHPPNWARSLTLIVLVVALLAAGGYIGTGVLDHLGRGHWWLFGPHAVLFTGAVRWAALGALGSGIFFVIGYGDYFVLRVRTATKSRSSGDK